jgi:hypothetical protein
MRRKKSKGSRTIHVRMQPQELIGLSYTSKRLGLTRSDVVRRCLAVGLPIFNGVELPTRGEH